MTIGGVTTFLRSGRWYLPSYVVLEDGPSMFSHPVRTFDIEGAKELATAVVSELRKPLRVLTREEYATQPRGDVMSAACGVKTWSQFAKSAHALIIYESRPGRLTIGWLSEGPRRAFMEPPYWKLEGPEGELASMIRAALVALNRERDEDD